MPVRKLTRGASAEAFGDAEVVSGGLADPLEPSAHEEPERERGRDGGGLAVPAELVGQLFAALIKAQQSEGPEKKQADRGDSGGGGKDADPLQQVLQQLLGGQQGNEPKGQGEKKQAKADQQQDGGSDNSSEECVPIPQWSPTRFGQAAAEVITQLHAAKQELAKEMEANLKQLKSVLQETQRIAKDMEAVLQEAKAEPSPQEQARGDSQKGNKAGQQQQKQQQKQRKQDVSPWDPPGLAADAGDDDDSPPPWQPPDYQSGDDQQDQQQH